MTAPHLPETYLGDGVYASYEHEGDQIWLRTRRENGDHVIALDPHTYRALVAFSAEVERERKGRACAS